MKWHFAATRDHVSNIPNYSYMKLCTPPKLRCTFYSNTHKTFIKIDYIPGHKGQLTVFQKSDTIEITSLNHTIMKLDISNDIEREEHYVLIKCTLKQLMS